MYILTLLSSCFSFLKTTGQNKNNSVIRLAAYLVRKGYFSKVEFVFLVAGHTKNAADRLFNALKLHYRKHNVYSMDHLIELCGKHPQVTTHKITWKDFLDWGTYFDRCYRKIKPLKKYQVFVASEVLGPNVIEKYSSNLDDAQVDRQILRRGIARRKNETDEELQKRK